MNGVGLYLEVLHGSVVHELFTNLSCTVPVEVHVDEEQETNREIKYSLTKILFHKKINNLYQQNYYLQKVKMSKYFFGIFLAKDV